MTNYNVSAITFLRSLYDSSCSTEPEFDRLVFEYNKNLKASDDPDMVIEREHLTDAEIQHRKIRSTYTALRTGKQVENVTCLAIMHSKGGYIVFFRLTITRVDGKQTSASMNIGGENSDPYTSTDSLARLVEIDHSLFVPLRLCFNSSDDRARVGDLIREYLLPTKPIDTASLWERVVYRCNCAAALVCGS